MGKNDFLSPKAIANRMKARGLEKLQWYCQMCEKQCRDGNGFKCHCMSEGHQRQMHVFGQNPNFVVECFSHEFEFTFLEHIKRSHGISRVAATCVYNEYIADRHHVHMNSTQWVTLTEFVKYLGKTGKCKVEETSKGWFIRYVDRGDDSERKRKRMRVRADLVDEEKQDWEIMKQIERAQQNNMMTNEGKLFKRGESDGGKIKIKLGAGNKEKGERLRVVFDEGETGGNKKKKPKKDATEKASKASALDEVMREQEMAKEHRNRKDYWLWEGIVVKVMSKTLGYYKQKGVVRKVIDKYVGEIEMIDTKHVLRVDQEELQTVIPQIGGLVKIVND
ncbi:KIN17-like protein [Apium graveolens]|uniref:KIN17-like protein n=1 Tax=Apium graveolens TaxID=4045 RepID=UPI003D7B587D